MLVLPSALRCCTWSEGMSSGMGGRRLAPPTGGVDRTCKTSMSCPLCLCVVHNKEHACRCWPNGFLHLVHACPCISLGSSPAGLGSRRPAACILLSGDRATEKNSAAAASHRPQHLSALAFIGILHSRAHPHLLLAPARSIRTCTWLAWVLHLPAFELALFQTGADIHCCIAKRTIGQNQAI